jgi:drug/metabolite transporter (DMT)-like permease
MIGLLGGMSAGAAYASVRGLGIRGVAGPTIVFDFAFFSTLIALPLFIIGYVPMTLRQLLIMLAAGVCATIAQFALTIAYRYAPSREISIFDYSNVLFTAMFGFLFLSEIPDRWSLVGYGLTFSMALLMFLYNKKHVDMPEKP